MRTVTKLLLPLLIILDLVIGAILYVAQELQQKQQIEDQLRTVSTLKTREIAHWRDRLLGEAAVLSESAFLAAGIEHFLREPQSPAANSLLARITSITRHYRHAGVMVVDDRDKVRMTDSHLISLEEHQEITAAIDQAKAIRRPVIGEICSHPTSNLASMAVAAPIFKDASTDQPIIGLLVLLSDPRQFLFPLVETWPVPSLTAESLLLETRDQDFIRYLGANPRDKARLDSSPFPASHPLRNLLAANRPGLPVTGLDYRDQPVVAIVQDIPDSHWQLITKIDKREVIDKWRSETLLLVVSFGGIAVLLIASSHYFRLHTKRQHLRQLLKAEQDIRRSAERSSIILHGIDDGIIVTDSQGRIELINPAAERFTGWPRRDALGKRLDEILTLQDIVRLPGAPRINQEGDDTAHQLHPIHRPQALVARHGRRIPVAVNYATLHDEKGLQIGKVVTLNDQSQSHFMQRLTEARLNIVEYACNHSLEDLLKKVLNEICFMVESAGAFFRFVETDHSLSGRQWSRFAADRLMACNEEEAHAIPENLWVECLRRRRPIVANTMAEEDAPTTRALTVPVLSVDRVVAIVGVSDKPEDYLEADIEAITYLADTAYHIIETIRRDEELRLSLQTSADLVRAIPLGLFIYQYSPPDYLVFLSGNLLAERIVGRDLPHLVGRDITDIWPKAHASGTTARFLEVMRSGITYEGEHADHDFGGTYRIRAFVLPGDRLAIVFEDISELRRSEMEKEKLHTQLLQSQKLESIGRLAGGVAHDFNNMLSVIIGNTEMVMVQTKRTSEIYNELEEIKKAGLRSADLTRQLLAFARKQTVVPRVVDLNQTIEGMLKMLRRLVGEDIQIVWDGQPGLHQIYVDPSQIDQILANLCVNARDAIDGIGKITVKTSNISRISALWPHNSELVPDDYVLLSFSDTGCGIPAAHIDHIFDPFFTTKKTCEGTGLGLATIYGIVKQNGGSIKVESEPGIGTTFHIVLPRYAGEAEVESPCLEAMEIPHGQGETVLLVEDETVILEMNAKMLERLGYRVLSTGSALKALDLARQHLDEVELLITDIIMPEMNGHELAVKILQEKPDMKCLYVSGYPANVIARQGILPGGMNFIQKPFMRRTLATKIHEILSADVVLSS